jgi:tetratricopeptide (TPR) repeat protein
MSLIYWHIAYLFVGLDDEYFHIVKANIFVKLGWYERAAKNYEKALKDSKDSRIHSMLGYCYTRMGHFDNAAENYRKIPSKKINPNDLYGLAYVEFQSGNLEKSHDLLQELRTSKNYLSTEQKEMIDILEDNIESIKWNRERTRH